MNSISKCARRHLEGAFGNGRLLRAIQHLLNVRVQARQTPVVLIRRKVDLWVCPRGPTQMKAPEVSTLTRDVHVTQYSLASHVLLCFPPLANTSASYRVTHMCYLEL